MRTLLIILSALAAFLAISRLTLAEEETSRAGAHSVWGEWICICKIDKGWVSCRVPSMFGHTIWPESAREPAWPFRERRVTTWDYQGELSIYDHNAFYVG
jgi:hypothetical protein